MNEEGSRPSIVAPEEAQPLIDELYQTYLNPDDGPPSTSTLVLWALTELVTARRKKAEAEEHFRMAHERYEQADKDRAHAERARYDLKSVNEQAQREAIRERNRAERAERNLSNALRLGVLAAMSKDDEEEDW